MEEIVGRELEEVAWALDSDARLTPSAGEPGPGWWKHFWLLCSLRRVFLWTMVSCQKVLHRPGPDLPAYPAVSSHWLEASRRKCGLHGNMVIDFREQLLEPFIHCALCSWRSSRHILMATQSTPCATDLLLHPDLGVTLPWVSWAMVGTVLTVDEWDWSINTLPLSLLVGYLYILTVTSMTEL